MFLWMSLCFLGLIAIWIGCCAALDKWEEMDRKKERDRPSFTERLVKYQERDY